MQDFDFAQIQSNFPKSKYFCPNFTSILPKFALIYPNPIKFAQKIAASGCTCISSFYALRYTILSNIGFYFSAKTVPWPNLQ